MNLFLVRSYARTARIASTAQTTQSAQTAQIRRKLHPTLRPNVAESVLQERQVDRITQIMHTAERRVAKQLCTRTAHKILPLSSRDNGAAVVRRLARGILLAQRARAAASWTDKWGVPLLSPANGVAHFILPLQRLYFAYCSHRGDSVGMKEYLTGQLAAFAKANPGVELVVEPRWGSVPLIRGYYIGGHDKVICVKNAKANEVHHVVMQLRNASGMPLRKFGQRVQSFAKAVRPLWSPFHMLNKGKNNPLQPFKSADRQCS